MAKKTGVIVKRETYNGHDLISIRNDRKDKSFRFGLRKAKKVLAARVQIEKFVTDQLKALAKQAKAAGRKKVRA